MLTMKIQSKFYKHWTTHSWGLAKENLGWTCRWMDRQPENIKAVPSSGGGIEKAAVTICTKVVILLMHWGGWITWELTIVPALRGYFKKKYVHS